ncbi:pullulanase [Paenibacillus sp. GSMTC-2017]|uniref:DUF6509 family protein n=1 Tax=Paenibacillus sp. GSMTC-2017 TaxID=2794350 RepID=UPI0018D880F7|nr:DUF6509 family protein [Paenibacillus sp. GSMTC-2017]MBH5319089.1 pullulanase [Paenibacillus sp. GSMTC-2017]
MFSIQEFSIEKIRDPYGILSGERFELLLDLEVEDDDELYLEEGVRLRVVYVKEEDGSSRIVKYEFLNASTNGYVDMEMEAEEQAFVDAFCKEQLELPLED